MIKEIKPSIYSVGSVDPKRKFFDQLIPLSDGTSYNSYLIKGSEKTALIDTVYPPYQDELIQKLKELKITKLDYIIANHGEQDHSGSIPTLLEIYPEAKVVTNPKCKEILKDLLLIEESKFQVIKDGEILSLGDKTFEFIFAPWVHWPDTMFTHLKEDNILFTCDFFGSHASDGTLYVEDEDKIYSAAKKYYAEIMMPFRMIFRKYFDKIEALNPKLIAPSHGPIYQNPEFILNAYRDWASDNVKNEAVIVHISMYGSTSKAVNYLSQNLEKKGITVKSYNAMDMDLGELAMDLVDVATVVFASPTVLTGPHPNIVNLIYLANVLKPKAKFAAIIGSYSWGGLMVDQMKSLLGNFKGEILNPVLIKGHPKPEDYKLLDNLIEEIDKRLSNLGIKPCPAKSSL